MTVSSTLRTGVFLALGTAMISGVSVYVSKFGTQAVPDPFVYTTARNLYVGLLLLAGLLVTGTIREVRGIGRGDWGRLALIAVAGGSVPFLLFFYGLSLTSAPVASFIQKTQVLWVALIAAPVLGEALGLWQAAGLLALLAGALVMGPVSAGGLGGGEALVLVATLLWSAETVLARRTLRAVHPAVGAAARMAGGAVVMLGVLAVSGRLPVLLGLTATQWLWVAGPGLLPLGYVLTWYWSLRHAPATLVTSVLALGAPVTALLNAALVTHVWPSAQTWGTVLLAAGAALVVGALWRTSQRVGIAPRAAGSYAHAS
jgi:drug/metabolite transporter (DMT)-like permease